MSWREICGVVVALRMGAGCFTDQGLVTASTGDGTTTTAGSTTDPATSEPPTTGPESVCGDQQVGAGEQCDLGADNSDAGVCTSNCQINVCGDGAKANTEGCDDGNLQDGDGCSAACTSEACGDGEVQPPEECDDGNQVEDDACSNLCRGPSCGDGIAQVGEECDNGANNSNTGACTLSCANAVCGDGFVGPGEQCDDGDLEDGDGCSGVCLNEDGPACGDGIVGPGEECDDGNDVDTDACLSGCVGATCGDGVVYAGVEECDDGDPIDDNACSNLCQTPEPDGCGDGALDADEECDDGNGLGGDGCSATCVLEFRRVFVTSEVYTGNLGGLAGAHEKCQSAADSAGLPGTYLAWLSSGVSWPAKTFTQSTVPYVRVDGELVAMNWDDLVDGTLINPIDVTETNGAPKAGVHLCNPMDEPMVWANTTFQGTLDNGGGSCSSWISAGNADSAWGNATKVGSGWSDWCKGAACSSEASLYCFEQ